MDLASANAMADEIVLQAFALNVVWEISSMLLAAGFFNRASLSLSTRLPKPTTSIELSKGWRIVSLRFCSVRVCGRDEAA